MSNRHHDDCLLLTVRPVAAATLAIVPLVWAFVGGSAAALLTVPTDYVLLGAGVVLIVALIATRTKANGVPTP